MHLHVSPSDGIPIYLQIVNQIKYLAASGGLTEKERLPSVRKLAEQLLVNPNTVARAYRDLEAEGVVASKRGAGVFVNGVGSPLNQKEQTRILAQRADMLLADARHMNVDIETICSLLRERHELLLNVSENQPLTSEDPQS